jgi:hypothetical protein
VYRKDLIFTYASEEEMKPTVLPKQGVQAILYFTKEKSSHGGERDMSKGPEFLNSLGSSEISVVSVVIQKLFEEFEDVFREELPTCSMPC